MLDDEDMAQIRAVVAEALAGGAGGDAAPAVVVAEPPTPEAIEAAGEAQAAVIEAQAEADVKVIAAEATAAVKREEAYRETAEVVAEATPEGEGEPAAGGDPGDPEPQGVKPKSDHWLVRPLF
jgi:hypothetical protein